MAVGDLFARLFSAGGTRGLSGDQDLVLPARPDLEFFNEGLRRHKTDVDFVAEPGALWDTGSFLARKAGLEAHLLSDQTEGFVGFTDVLFVINSADWRRTFKQVREPWTDRAAAVLGDKLAAHCEQQDLHFLFPQRTPRFIFLEDGSAETNGESLGLGKGEFVTGLLGSQYAGPQRSSRPIVAVHLSLPEVWEGYREVGRLYSDQMLFTMGTHWLDSFSHPAMQRPALYRLQHFADGSFVHVINPDVQEMYRIRSEESETGPAVLTIEDLVGDPVAHLVLAVVETTDLEEPAPAPVSAAPSGQLRAPPDHPTVPQPAPPGAPLVPPRPTSNHVSTAPLGMQGSKTVVPLEMDERMLTLRENGALLQKVHFARFMEGYDVYLGDRGEIATAMRDPAVVVRVRGAGVSILPYQEGVRVSGHPLRRGKERVLKGRAMITVGEQVFEYIDLSGTRVEGWPYVGELRRQGSTVRLVFGDTYKIGRDRRCKVRLPDEPHNDNIVWRPEVGAGATIRSRTGDIPKSRFYTDSIMVASEHAEIDLGNEPVLHCTARHCFAFVRRGADIFSLVPTRSRSGGPRNMDLQPGDEILIGNQVLAVSYPPAESHSEELASERLSRRTPLSARELAAAADTSVSDAAEGLPRRGHAPGPDELPAAAGLGEAGPAPSRPKISLDALDSVLGIEPPEAPHLGPVGDEPVPPPSIAAPMLLEDLDDSFSPDVPPKALKRPPRDLAPPMLLDEDDAEEADAAPAAGAEASRAEVEPDPSDVPQGPPPPLPLDAAPDSILGIPEDYGLEPEPSRTPAAGASPAASPEASPADGADLPVGRPPPVPIDKAADSILGIPFEDEPDELDGPPAEEDSTAESTTEGPGPDDDDDLDDLDDTASDITADAGLRDADADADADDDESPEELAATDDWPAEETYELESSSALLDEEALPSPVAEAEAAPPAPPAPPPRQPEADSESVPPAGEESLGEVVEIDEIGSQLELSRPARVVLGGWMLSGRVRVGNHAAADVVVPENRMERGQTFTARDYFQLKVRGSRFKARCVDTSEAFLVQGGESLAETAATEDLRLDVLRRDADGDEDFIVRLGLGAEPMLPDPRARLLVVDQSDRVVEALFTRGLPLGAPRPMALGPLAATFRFDGQHVVVSDYLGTYRRPDGSFQPFFVSRGGEAFQTMPEDGREVALESGDRLIAGIVLYRIRS